MSQSTETSNGVGGTTLLFLLFLGLKLGHVINWSWWWVTAPLWGGLALALVLIGVVLLVAAVCDR